MTAGLVTTTTFDARGQLQTVKTPNGKGTTYRYTQTGQVASVVVPGGDKTVYTYDSVGNRTDVVRHAQAVDVALRRATSTTFDLAGNPLVTTGPTEVTTQKQYDNAGRLKKTIDQAGRETVVTYDAFNRTDTQKLPGQDPAVFTYDKAGNVDTSTNPLEQATGFTYDKANRLTGVTYGGATPDIDYVLNPLGAARKATQTVGEDVVSERVVEYDNTGRVIRDATDGRAVAYKYDVSGAQTKMTYPSGLTAERDYDKASRWTRLTVADAHSSDRYDFSYNKDGQLTGTTYPNTMTATRAYDAASQPTGVTFKKGTTTLGSYTQTFDPVLRLPTTRKTVATGLTASTDTYGWDGQDRLTASTTTGAATDSFEYDPSSTLQRVAGATLTIDTPTGQATSANPTNGGPNTNFSYDGVGRRTGALTGANNDEFTWDQANQLTGYNPASGPTNTYTYAADGLRNSVTRGNDATALMTWDRTTSIPMLLSDGDREYVYGPAAPLAEIAITSGTRSYLLTDLSNSVRRQADNAGVITSTRTYDAWGNTKTSTGTNPARLGYAGEYTDTTGFIYLRARYYDPKTGSFLSVDPIAFATGDLYQYTRGNPIQFGDPLGLATTPEEDIRQIKAARQTAIDVGLVATGIAVTCAAAGLVLAETVVGGVAGGACASTAIIAATALSLYVVAADIQLRWMCDDDSISNWDIAVDVVGLIPGGRLARLGQITDDTYSISQIQARNEENFVGSFLNFAFNSGQKASSW